MRLTKRQFLGASAAVLAQALLAACGGTTAAPSSPAESPGSAKPAGGSGAPAASPAAGSAAAAGAAAKPTGSLTMAMSSVPPTMLSYDIADSAVKNTMIAVNTTMFNAAADGTITPGLITSWKGEGTSWQLKIREDAKFSDGSNVTADDFKFSLERLVNPDNKYLQAYYLQPYIKGVTVVDPKTVTVETKSPVGILPLVLGNPQNNFSVVSKAAWDKIGPDGYASKPVTVGPYVVKSFTPKQTLVLEPNPYFWSPGKIGQITLQALPVEAARVAALKSNQVQLASQLTTDSVASLKSAGFNVGGFSSGRVITIGVIPLSRPSLPEVLRDVRVRRAMTMAIDRENIVKTVQGEFGRVAYQLADKSTVGYNPDLPPIPYDVAQAKQLIQQAGAQGAKLTLVSSSSTPLNGSTPIQAIGAAWKDIGLDMTIQLPETAVQNQQLVKGELFLSAVAFNVAQDLGLNIANIVGTGDKPEQAGYRPPEFQKLVTDSNAEFDPKKRTSLMQQMVKMIYDDVSFMPYAYEQTIIATTSAVKGLAATPAFVTPDWTALSVA